MLGNQQKKPHFVCKLIMGIQHVPIFLKKNLLFGTH